MGESPRNLEISPKVGVELEFRGRKPTEFKNTPKAGRGVSDFA